MLRRRWARAAWALLAAAGILAGISFIAPLWELETLKNVCGMGVFLFFGAYLLARCVFLRCPNCRRGLAPARWSAGDDGYCRYCGKPFTFDDAKGEDGP